MDEALIEVNIKTPNDRKSVKVKPDSTVKDLRTEISRIYDVTIERLCLIFAGKILKDDEKLVDAKIIDGVSVHLVIRQPSSRPNESIANNQAPVSQPNPPSTFPPPSEPATFNAPSNPFGMMGQPDLLGMLGGMGGRGGGAGSNLEDMQRNMQQQLINNPEMMRSMLENPFMQNLLQSPEMMNTMVQGNPQIRQLMERNPEVRQILNNPSMMREVMEMMRNPAMVQELMRHHDRALLNVEAFPGGMNHLTRLYRDIQEPLMEATTPANPFASLAGSRTTNTNTQSENNEPLPNPWSGGTTQSGPATSTNTAPTNASTTGTGNVPSAEGLQNLLGSINDPRMRSMMDMLRDNPQFTEMALANSPMIASNPQMQEQIRNNMPSILQAFDRPEVRNSLGNPRVLQAMFQIQQGVQILQSEAPHMLNALPNQVPVSNNSNPTANTTTSAVPTSTPSDGTFNPNSPQMANMISSMLSMMTANQQGTGGTVPQTPQPNSNPEQTYATQLETMSQMGFPNRQANLRALIATFGDISAAVNRILQFDP